MQSTETQAPNAALLDAVSSFTKRIENLTSPSVNSTHQVHFNQVAPQEHHQQMNPSGDMNTQTLTPCNPYNSNVQLSRDILWELTFLKTLRTC